MRQNCRIEVWVSEAIAEAVKQLAEAQLTTESHIGRQALHYFLQQLGAIPQPNGRRKPMREEELTDGA